MMQANAPPQGSAQTCLSQRVPAPRFQRNEVRSAHKRLVPDFVSYVAEVALLTVDVAEEPATREGQLGLVHKLVVNMTDLEGRQKLHDERP